MQFFDLWMQSIGAAIYYLLVYLSKVVKSTEIWIGKYVSVHLFLWFIFFHSDPQLSSAVPNFL